MSVRWIAPDCLFDGTSMQDRAAICVEGDVVVAVDTAPAEAMRLKGCITPGYVDLQVNGGGGVLLNANPTREGMAAIAAAHRRFGTVGVMPTVITDAPEVLDRAAEAAMAAAGDDGIVGLHIEGPHISVARRGTHAAEHIRPLDARTMDIVAGLRAAGVPVMITVAPEAASNEQIAAMAATGAVVSLGHTDADAKTVEAALRAGATCATHLFNAMSPMQTRAPGAVGAVMGADCYAGLICDGHHVDARMVALALCGRPVPDRMFLVSDAMATVGGPDVFELYGQPIRLKDGRLINAEGNLAGAHVTQAEGVTRLIGRIGVAPETALRMAITTPAEVIGQRHLATLIGRAARDVLVLDEAFAVTGTVSDLGAA